NEPDARRLGNGDVAFVVAHESVATSFLAKEMERREMGQLQPVVKDQGGLDATVGQEHGIGQLRQMLAIRAHGPCPHGCVVGDLRGPRATAWPWRSVA